MNWDGYVDADDDPQEWNGEGYPPVGCECELLRDRLSHPEWVPVKITGRGERVTVFRRLSRAGIEEITEANPDEFRPLRTKEQLERDELAEVIAEAATLKAAVVLDTGQYDVLADAILAKYTLTEK